jgi:hypothetical protein
MDRFICKKNWSKSSYVVAEHPIFPCCLSETTGRGAVGNRRQLGGGRRRTICFACPPHVAALRGHASEPCGHGWLWSSRPERSGGVGVCLGSLRWIAAQSAGSNRPLPQTLCLLRCRRFVVVVNWSPFGVPSPWIRLLVATLHQLDFPNTANPPVWCLEKVYCGCSDESSHLPPSLIQSLTFICSQAVHQARRSSGFSCEEDGSLLCKASGVKNMKLDGSLRTTAALCQFFCVMCRPLLF